MLRKVVRADVRSRKVASATGLLTVALFAAGTSIAAADSVRHATSQQPHWEVGKLDPALSTACRRQRFNQLTDHRLYIAFRGDDGAGVTGVARLAWNLYDPDRRAIRDATYHFADDGLSTCRVYVAMPKKPVL